MPRMRKLFNAVLLQSSFVGFVWSYDPIEEIVNLERHQILSVSFEQNSTDSGFTLRQSVGPSLAILHFDDEGGVANLMHFKNQTFESRSYTVSYCRKPVNLTAFDPPLDWPDDATIYGNYEGTRAIGFFVNDTSGKVEFIGRGAKEKKTRSLLSVPGKGTEEVHGSIGSQVTIHVFNTTTSVASELIQSFVVIDCQNSEVVSTRQLQAQKAIFIQPYSQAGFLVTPNNTLVSLMNFPGARSVIPAMQAFPPSVSVHTIDVESNLMLVTFRDMATHEDKFQFFGGPIWFEALGPAAKGNAAFIGSMGRGDITRGEQLGKMRYFFYRVRQNGRDILKTWMEFDPYFSVSKTPSIEEEENAFKEICQPEWTAEVVQRWGQMAKKGLEQKLYRGKDIEIPSGLNIEPTWSPITPISFMVVGDEGHPIPVHYWRAENSKGLFLDLHGGPHVYQDAEPSWLIQAFLRQGYSYARPEPRGSDGYGHNHSVALMGRWNDVDVADVISVVRHLRDEKKYENIFLGGTSYGGFLAAAVAGKHSELFKGVVPAMGIYDLGLAERTDPENRGALFDNVTRKKIESDYFREWRARYGFNAAHDTQRDQAVSPVYSVGNVSIPMLLIHGQNDTNCFPNQFFRYFNESMSKKRNITGLLIKDEGHGFSLSHSIKTFIDLVPKFFNTILSGQYQAPEPEQTYFEIGEDYAKDSKKVIDSFHAR